MLLAGFPAGMFGTNCFVVAPGPGSECVVVDPGQDAVPPLADLLAEHRLHPVAVLLTHGHLDHTWSVVPVCRGHGVAAWIHPDDRAMLADPALGLSADVVAQVLPGLRFTEPDEVRELSDGVGLELAGLPISVAHAPGHTPGSVVFGLAGDGDTPPALLSGDLVFAGSVGRTDLPGGDWDTLLASLARVVLPLDDATLLLPGHGPVSTVGQERRTNPFLTGLVPDGPAGATGAARGRWV